MFRQQRLLRQEVPSGGKAEALHSKNGCLEVREPGDQLEDDRSVHALLNNYASRQPLVLLADDNYRLFPFDLAANGYTYVVLGLYWITHAWGGSPVSHV
jgi:hypothetical protein